MNLLTLEPWASGQLALAEAGGFAHLHRLPACILPSKSVCNYAIQRRTRTAYC